jgi:hypothetical protein
MVKPETHFCKSIASPQKILTHNLNRDRKVDRNYNKEAMRIVPIGLLTGWITRS